MARMQRVRTALEYDDQYARLGNERRPALEAAGLFFGAGVDKAV
jgi:hypothetical protein